MNKVKNIFFIYNLIIILFFNFCQMNENNPDENKSSKIISFEVNHHDNSLMAIINVSLSEKGKIKIFYLNDDSRLKESAESSYVHEITIIGLRENTSYDFYFEAEFENEMERSNTIRFKTDSAPIGVPEVKLLSKQDGSFEGITLFGLTVSLDEVIEGPVYWGFDEEGYVVWYYHGTGISQKAPSQPVIRSIGENNLMIFLNSEIRIISCSGEIKESYSLPSNIQMHHDAILLPNDNIILLSKEFGVFNGEKIIGDKIYELDKEGNQVWSWSSFDHLDIDRFPGDLSKIESPKGLDWSHSNALFYNYNDDSILLSIRSQSWIVKIDHKSGEIKWILGNDLEVSSEYDKDFFILRNGTWFSNQHAPVIEENGNILIYDNRNESGGESGKSRAVIYEIDEDSLNAYQVWEYIVPKYTNSLGDVDYLSNKNIFVCAGGPERNGSNNQFGYLIEVSSDKDASVLWELKVKGLIYRAEKISWTIFK